MNNRGIGAWAATRRRKSPKHIALISADGERLSYEELGERAESIAAELIAEGIRRGDRVAFLGENSPAFFEALFGAAILGVVFVPLNTRLAAPELAYILADAEVKLVFTDDALRERATDAAAEAAVRTVVRALGEIADRPTADVPTRAAEHDVAQEDPALILYTSGTTGRPKGAELTHANLIWNSVNVLVDYDVTSREVALMISPLFHAAALGMGALPVLLKGGTLVLERGFDPGRALALIEEHGVTMISGVPTTFQMMADHPAWATTDLSSLTTLTCGGSPASERIIEAYQDRGLSFTQGYGMTEASPGATALSADAAATRHGSVGLGHFFTEVRIVGDDGSLLPARGVGEVEVRGPNVFGRYINLPVESAAAFAPEGWFRSGDLGFLDEEGFLYIVDRRKDMIISGGENIYSAEVEEALLHVPGITGAALVGVEDDQWGEVPWAFVTVSDGTIVDTAAVALALDGRIARYKIPKRVIVRDELPRTAAGKVRKQALREELADAPDPR